MRYKKYKRQIPKQPKGAPSWMVTYSDLFTLILVFFILLFSMSQIDMIKFKAITESFRDFQILDYQSSIIPSENTENGDTGQNSDAEETMDGLLEEVQAFLQENDLGSVAVANRTEQGVVLVLQEQILFASGEAEIIEDAYPLLNKIGGLLAEIPHIVRVEGHTDSRPISTYRYPSNWELSTARSSSVIRYFIQTLHLDSRRFIATGYGPTRPVEDNDTPENMMKNRRVEIIIVDPNFQQSDKPQ
ncbi:flagellar motor protein MotB [Bacillaceae bacterium Marseille-Q3522]|nr:flagellar motor protein MotB [Bacillaceae bacterium Marseille-Q3522]